MTGTMWQSVIPCSSIRAIIFEASKLSMITVLAPIHW